MDKPQAPSDLWVEMDQIVGALSAHISHQPEGTFTTREYADHYKCSVRTAREKVAKLVTLGKVTQVSNWGKTNYYRMVDK
jgi:hypothetical protein